MFFILKNIIYFLVVAICLLLSVAFFTVFERQTLGYIQRRQGPNIIGFFGILQAIADGLKLLLKESIFPKSSNLIIFILAPIFSFGLALSTWVVIPFGDGWAVADFNLGILYLLSISSLSVHSIIMAGWSSNSKYAFLGALRSAAQMVSYEIAMSITLMTVVLLVGSLNLNEVVIAQSNIWFMFPLFPMFIVFFICMLAETNRHPFDLPEAEAELVSGYNVEYSAMGFALFFLAEYSNIIMMASIITLLFFGGWHYFAFLSFLPNIFWLSIKILFFIFLFILVRATYPRYRYDQLMRLGWKIFLPISLAFFTMLASVWVLII